MTAEPRRTVYLWEGPPRIELWTQQVEVAGRSWLQHGLSTGPGTPGAIVVAERDGHLLFVEHVRPVAGGRTFLELPRGFAEIVDGDAADRDAACVRTAERELAEETGEELVNGRVLGFVWPDTGVLAADVAVVHGTVRAARAADRFPAPLDGEATTVLWVAKTAVADLIRRGRIADGLTLAALSLTLAQ